MRIESSKIHVSPFTKPIQLGTITLLQDLIFKDPGVFVSHFPNVTHSAVAVHNY